MKTTESMNVLVYGGTGSQASPTVRHLLAGGHQPTILTRNPDKAAELVAVGAKIVIGDMADKDSLVAASTGMDAVALLIPAFLDNPMAATDYAKHAIDAAAAAGVKLIVWNTSGPMPPQRVGNPMADSRLDVYDYLKASGVPNIVIAPSAYAENLLGPWTRGAVIERDQVAYPVLADRAIGWIPSDDVGKLVVAALQRPELTGQIFYVSGEGVTGTQLAQIFNEALGRDITYYTMSPEEMGAAIDAAFGPGAGEQVAAAYRAEQSNPNPPPMHFDMSAVLSALPVELTPLLIWVRQHAPAFTS